MYDEIFLQIGRKVQQNGSSIIPTKKPTIKQYSAEGIMVESNIRVNPMLRNTFKTPSQRAVVRNCPSRNFCFMSAKYPGLARARLPDSIEILRLKVWKIRLSENAGLYNLYYSKNVFEVFNEKTTHGISLF
jgi:hypothetical protein